MRSLIGKLAWSNIRKRKSATATLFVLILLAASLLIIGLTVSLKLNSFQQEKMTELGTPEFSTYFVNDKHVKDYETLVDNYPYTDSWENEPALVLADARVKYGETDTMTLVNPFLLYTIITNTLIPSVALLRNRFWGR